MGMMLHLAFKRGDGSGVPSPVDGDPTIPWPLDTWASLMPRFTAAGVTVPVLPPMTKGATFGAGYDPFDHYDLGSKNQQGRRETRYGSVERAMRFIAICHALGQQVYVNVVHHHVDGDNGDMVYRYIGADGKTLNGRFPKDRHCFTDRWPNPDHVADPDWDLAYGREFEWNLGWYGDGEGDNRPGYVRRSLATALGWQTRRLGVEGYFLDDAKGTSPEYVGYLLTHDIMADKVAFAEYSDGNTQTLVNWMHSRAIGGRCGVMDFALRYKIRDVLDYGADMRVILSEGVCWRDPTRAITFVEDLDLALSDPIIWSKLLGYAMIATFPGYPMLFLEDLLKYGLIDPVLNLCWIHETLSKGDFVLHAATSDYLVFERMGDSTSSGCLVGITKRIGSYANPADWQPVRVPSKWRNTELHDVTGHSQNQWTSVDGHVTLWLAPNDYGRGYVVFAPTGIDNPIHLPPRRIQQQLIGDDELDIRAARNGVHAIGMVWAKAGTRMEIVIDTDRSNWSDDSALSVEAIDKSGAVVVSALISNATTTAIGTTLATGKHTLVLTGSGLAPAGTPFKLWITYQAPAILHEEDFAF